MHCHCDRFHQILPPHKQVYLYIQSTMGKKITSTEEPAPEQHKKTKATRFDEAAEPQDNDKHTWPSNAVVYVGHLPYGFQEEQLKAYFSQYGDVLGVKLARSRISARSKGYAFIQFRYPEVAEVVSDTMNGYLLMGKVLVSNVLKSTQKNPFAFSSSGKYRFINWKRIFVQQTNEPKSEEQTAKIIHNLLKNEEKKRQKLKQLNIDYEYPGFSSYLPKEEPKSVKQSVPKAKEGKTKKIK